MADYDFSTLNSTDLEELTCALLNAKEPSDSNIKYRTFKEGKDKGIDILYSTDLNNYEHVGQVKHFFRTGFRGLYNHLKKEELKKIRLLNPTKYIIATSVDLSIFNIESIQKLFAPLIKNLSDIYGKKDLNYLLEQHESVLADCYKLWFCDTSVLKKILNSDLEFRSSAFIESEFKRRLRLYVRTPLFDKARRNLKENKFIVITGEPGVGKTTLAEMLVYEYILDDYKLTYILDDIKEADRVLDLSAQKQIIYFDDFLGSNSIEINKAKGSETILRKILRRVAATENKLIVFTTRTFLLNTAVSESENLRRFNIKAKESILELSEYSKELKRELLRNHIEDCDLNNNLKIILNSKEIQEFIINHKNFTPRSIEFITSVDIIKDFSVELYKEFIYSSFNSPIDIWEHAYTEQIEEDDRLLLNTLLSFGELANISELEIAFNKRFELEIRTNNRTKKINAFTKSLKRLNGGFVIIKNNNEVNFINPSLTDFLLVHIRGDKNEVARIVESVTFTSQLTQRLFSLQPYQLMTIPKSLKKRLLEDYYSFVSHENEDRDLIQLSLIIYNYIKTPDAIDIVCKILNDISDWDSLYIDYSLNVNFREFLDSTTLDSPKIKKIIDERMAEILRDLVYGENDIHEAVDVLEDLLKKYKINLLSFDNTVIEEHLSKLLTEFMDQEIDWLKDFINDESEVFEKKEEIKMLNTRINKIGLKLKVDFGVFDHNDWFEIAMHNEFQRLMEKDD